MRGPPRTPSAILKSRGSWRARHRTEDPQPEVRAPEPPQSLSDAATPYWNSLVVDLIELDVLSSADGVALAEFAEALAEVEELRAILRTEGRTIDGAAGSKIAHPITYQLNQARSRVLHYSREFGLTPAARSRVKANTANDEPKDEKSQLLRVVV
jgi:P27 family predicted phage terminase small subunit